MKTYIRIFFLSIIAISIVQPSKAQAQNTGDFYFQQALERYFQYPQNARTFAMAGSNITTSTDSSSVLGNPAGLGLMRGGEVSSSYSYNRITGNEFPTNNLIRQRGNMGSAIIAMPIVPTTDGLPEYGNFGAAWDVY